MATKYGMSESGQKILAFLKKYPNKEFTKRQLVVELDLSMSAVTGNINSFLNKGYITERVEEWVDKDNHIHVDRYSKITEVGKAFDPVADERAKKQKLLEEKAQRKYEKIQQQRKALFGLEEE